MLETINRNTLKYHCAHAISCPECKQILDCRQAVEIDVVENGVESCARLRRSYVLCTRCWEKHKLAMHDFATQSNGKYTVEILDGRELFRTTRRNAQ